MGFLLNRFSPFVNKSPCQFNFHYILSLIGDLFVLPRVCMLIWLINKIGQLINSFIARGLLGFEFVMLANHDKTWQKLSLIGLEWSTLKSKTKNSSLGWKKWVTSYFVRLVLDQSKIAYQQKSANIKNP